MSVHIEPATPLPTTDVEQPRYFRGFFLGGLISACLLALSFPPYEERVLPWFALVPLLVSLDRNRSRPAMRWVHALLFSGVLCAWAMQPLFQAALGEAERAGKLGWIGVAGVTLRNVGLWLVLALGWGLFGAASGVLMRSKRTFETLVGLPLLWTGIEYLRVECSPWPLPWLVLGQSLEPASPEAQLAAGLGIFGLSFAVLLANTAFFLVLRQPTWQRQATLAALGCVVFLGAHAGGELRPEIEEGASKLRAGIVQAEGEGPEGALKLAEGIVTSEPDVVVFSARALGTPGADSLHVGASVRAFALEHRVDAMAQVERRPDSPSVPRWATYHVAKDGALAGTDYDDAATGNSGPANAARKDGLSIFNVCGVRVGLGMEGDFDSPRAASRLAAAGAQVLVSISGEDRRSGEGFAILRARLHALRAIETRRWLVRATPGGVSAVIDPCGRPQHLAPLGQEMALVEEVWALEAPSPLLQWGWVFGPLCGAAAVAVMLAAAIGAVRRRWKPISTASTA